MAHARRRRYRAAPAVDTGTGTGTGRRWRRPRCRKAARVVLAAVKERQSGGSGPGCGEHGRGSCRHHGGSQRQDRRLLTRRGEEEISSGGAEALAHCKILDSTTQPEVKIHSNFIIAHWWARGSWSSRRPYRCRCSPSRSRGWLQYVQLNRPAPGASVTLRVRSNVWELY
jgi:hypothetical protein